MSTPAASHEVVFRWLGTVPYDETWSAQEDFATRMAEQTDMPDELWLLEHEPVYTMGRTPDQSSLRDRAQLPHPLFEINRGGQATWHGPGQLVGYALFDLRRRGRDLHAHLRHLEDILIFALRDFGLNADRREGLTGVWIDHRKIASIGVGVRRWIAMHGFALNVSCDLTAFQSITPCGIAGVEMTSIAKETGTAPDIQTVSESVKRIVRGRS